MVIQHYISNGLFAFENVQINVMPESNRYTTISVTEGVKADLVARQEANDTYSSVIRRALDEQELSEDKIKSRLNYNATLLQELCGVIGEIAEQEDIPEEDLPDNIREYSKRRDPTDPFSLSKEAAKAIQDSEDEDATEEDSDNPAFLKGDNGGDN
jgi:hypothetical protein